MDTTRPTEADRLESVLMEIRKVIVGQDRILERMLVSLLAGGHCLLEGVPGLAKTLAVETLSRTIGGEFARIQFTPDLLPADIMGTRIYRGSTEQFDVELGPVMTNILLADEINRAPAKVQSALLEVMAEHQVSIGGETHRVPEPFLVLATQNPIESEGVYPLPEAQRDRFLMKLLLDYPTPAEEVEIVQRMGVKSPEARQVLSPEELVDLQETARSIYCDRLVVDYAVALVFATRSPEQHGLTELESYIEFGASPRASLGLIAAGRALAMLRGRSYVIPQDVFDVAPEVLRHRVVLTYEALAQNLTSDQILNRILATVPAPRFTPQQPTAEPSRSTSPPPPSSFGQPAIEPPSGAGVTTPAAQAPSVETWGPSGTESGQAVTAYEDAGLERSGYGGGPVPPPLDNGSTITSGDSYDDTWASTRPTPPADERT